MHHEQVPSAELRRLATEQHDLLTIRQAGAASLTKDSVSRITNQGYWRRLGSGLYDTAPSHDDVHKRIWAAALQAGTPYAIGGEAALVLHGLDRVVDRVVVWVPDSRHPRPASAAQFRRDQIGRVDRAIGSPARIRLEDAVVDVGQRLSLEELIALLTDATRMRATTLPRIRQALDGRGRVRHRRDFVDILDDLTGIESNLEYVFRQDVERAHGLPTSSRQDSMSAGTRTDVIYEEHALLVELDGRFGHADTRSAFRDLHRDNAHAVRDLLTLRYGSADVRGKPCEVAAQLATTLGNRGWQGQMVRCPRCAKQGGRFLVQTPPTRPL